MEPTMSVLDGMLPIHKPAGMVSKDVSRWLTKRFGRLKLGHVGTLDPGASGVLPILVGRATRLQDYLLDLPKAYEFDMRLGEETDSLDLDGQLIKTSPWEHVTLEGIRASCQRLLGPIQQTPPIYSAIKFRGKALYDYVRSGRECEVPLEELKRHVHVYSLECLSLTGRVATLKVRCSKGTYVRSLAKDLAEMVGSCATLTRLVRTEAAGVDLAKTHDLDTLYASEGHLSLFVTPIHELKLKLGSWQSRSESITRHILSGRDVLFDEGVAQFASEGDLISGSGKMQASWLLLDTDGVAIGIGCAHRNGLGRAVIQLKRGL